MKTAALFVAMFGTVSMAMAQDAPSEYGAPIELSAAKKVMAAAEAKAREENWPVAIAIVDNAGMLVMFQRLENTQLGSVQVAIEKAKTSALFRRPTKAFEDRLAEGGANVKLLTLPGALPLEGGLPIIAGGKVIGAIGVSGVASDQDAMIGQAGLDALAQLQNAAAGPAARSVSGTVTVDGQPLVDASVVFVPEKGRPVAGTTDAAGQYKVTSIPERTPMAAGRYRVRISTGREPGQQPDGTITPAHPESLPPKYNSRTELHVTIEAGTDNIFDFDLRSGQ